MLFASALSIGCLVPVIAVPMTADAAVPDVLVYDVDGKEIKVNYVDYQDVMFGENDDLKNYLAGKAPKIIGMNGSYISYINFQDALFEMTDLSAPAIIDELLKKPSNILDETKTAGFIQLVSFENGQPVFNTELPDTEEFAVLDIY